VHLSGLNVANLAYATATYVRPNTRRSCRSVMLVRSYKFILHFVMGLQIIFKARTGNGYHLYLWLRKLMEKRVVSSSKISKYAYVCRESLYVDCDI
jgi:hypothetical protein